MRQSCVTVSIITNRTINYRVLIKTCWSYRLNVTAKISSFGLHCSFHSRIETLEKLYLCRAIAMLRDLRLSNLSSSSESVELESEL
jgi:hypothetical protein